MNAIDIGLYVMYAAAVIAVLSAIVLPLVNLLQNPRALIRGGVVVAVVLIVFLVGFATSSPDVTAKYTALGVDGQSVRLIGAGLTLLYVFVIGSVVTIVVSELTKMFR